MRYPSLKYRKEPKTKEEIKKEIIFLSNYLNSRLGEAVEDRIYRLKQKLFKTA